MFYTFSQNNSGGSFDFNEEAGITHYVIVEADNSDQASARAQDIGLYFNGCDEGIDCHCCGDRWSEPWKDDGDAQPLYYDQPVAEAISPYPCRNGKDICVHYADGRREWYNIRKG